MGGNQEVRLPEEQPTRFKEASSEAAQRETRSNLWSAVEEARKRGEKAFFVGNRATLMRKKLEYKAIQC